jgi:aryl-alcohol dehydrogenase-like predicted oxidoreductase
MEVFMQYRQLGKSGVKVSVIGLGTNRFGGPADQEAVNTMIGLALELGINFIDTADVYQGGRSEAFLGNALKGHWHEFVVATKFRHKMGEGPNDLGASRYHLMNAVEASLRRLQSDHIDLYQVHRYDENTPIEETLRGLDDLVRSGKVRYIGASNFAAWQLGRANLLAEVRGWSSFITIQPHYHMMERDIERELLPYCRADGIGILPYFPLAGGFLTGKYKRGQAAPAGSRGEESPYVQKYMTDANYDRLEQLTAWAEARGRRMGELAHAWLLGHPEVSSVISGATRPEQVRDNAKAADWNLTGAEMEEINTVLGA